MSGKLLLNGTWGLLWAEGSPLVPAHHLTGTYLHGRRLLAAQVPAPIHQVLMDAGLLDDPNIGLNSLRARWVEEMFWVYRHTFSAPAAAAQERAWLKFARLELEARVWLNGQEIGQHQNAHRPACFEVTGKLQEGTNLLVVELSTGLHSAAEKPSTGYVDTIGQLTKRHWHRHPQCQSGWDWQGRLLNVGILGDVELEWHPGPRLDQVTVFAVPTNDLQSATVTVRAAIEGCNAVGSDNQPILATLRATISETGQVVEGQVAVKPGISRHELCLKLTNPALWWPIGHGAQNLYTVQVALETPNDIQKVERRIGVRRVEIDQSPHPVEGRYCMLRINNRPIFCKGGNWVPADLLYSTVTPERYRSLVQLAVAANFNTLRIWGGGLLATHALCEACDELGIIIWHDLLFACAQYPGTDPDFAAEVRREVTWQVREMAHHPSVVVWCGNNEIEQGDWGWGYDHRHPAHPHYVIFHRDIPRIVHAEDPSKIHWVSSPISPDWHDPNDPTVGDQHPWAVSLGNPGGADFWVYRQNVDRFPNEGGVLGASSPATLRQFLPENERYMFSPSWDHHDNPFASIDHGRGELGHAYKTVQMWIGRDPLNMPWEEYAFASALLQAEGLMEYITNYRRRMFSSAAAIFWMYNDAWPTTHGWTIVDYYQRRKLAYHPVRRAFQPITVVVADEGDQIGVYGVNDTPTAWAGTLRYGLFGLTGGYPLDESRQVTLDANAATRLATLPRRYWEAVGWENAGAFALLYAGDQVLAQHRLFLTRFKDLRLVHPTIRWTRQSDRVTLSSDAFAWGVCLDLDGEQPLADNCFDLLPGIAYSLPWNAALGEPRVAGVGNRLVLV